MRKNQLIYDSYRNRKVNEFYDFDGIQRYIKYDYSSFLILLLIILGIAPVFVYEKELGMDSIIRTTKNGHRKTVRAKKTATLIYTFIVSVVMLLSDFILFSASDHLAGFNAPIYCIDYFRFSTLTMTIWQYLLFTTLIKLLCFILIAYIVLLVSSLSPNSLVAFVVSVIPIVIMLVSNISIYNPMILAKNRELFGGFEVANLFDYPIPSYMCVLALFIILFVSVSIIISLLNRKRITFDFIKVKNSIRRG